MRTANFTANNSEAGYTFTVQAENKAGKGAVSPPSAPRRATGKLGQVSGVSATAADTGGAGRQVTINFKRTDCGRTQRLGLRTKSATATTPAPARAVRSRPARRWAASPTARQTTITVTANSSVAPSSDASAPAAATPYGSPGTPSAPGRTAAMNQKSLTLELDLAVDGDQRRCRDQDQDRRRRLGNVSRLRQPDHQHRRLRAKPHRSRCRPSTRWEPASGDRQRHAPHPAAPGRAGTPPSSTARMVRTCTVRIRQGQTYRRHALLRLPAVVKNGDATAVDLRTAATDFVVSCYDRARTTMDAAHRTSGTGSKPARDRNVGRYIVAGHTTLGRARLHGIPQC